MNTILRRAGAALIPLLLVACASVPKAPNRVNLQGQCAPSLAALQPTPLGASIAPEGKKVKPAALTDFAALGQCVEDEKGRVATIMWKLQEVPLPSMVRLEIIANDAATLAAGMALLDAQHQVVRRHGFNEFARRGRSFTLDMFLNPSDDGVRYLVLTPDPDWVGKQDETISGITNTVYLAYGAVYNYGTEGKSIRQLSDAGQLRIQILPL